MITGWEGSPPACPVMVMPARRRGRFCQARVRALVNRVNAFRSVLASYGRGPWTSPHGRGRARHERLPGAKGAAGVAVSATLSGFVFGYELAVISGALLFVRQDLGLSGLQQGALVSAVPLGAMLGGVVAAGRGRAGAPAGADPRRRAVHRRHGAGGGRPDLRGPARRARRDRRRRGRRLVDRASVSVGDRAARQARTARDAQPAHGHSGIVVAYCVGLAFSRSGDWRTMFGVSLVPSGLLLVGMLRAP
jgi:SP family galactose:H+ symporter-like MFS transporter